jgi:hypothetical protein
VPPMFRLSPLCASRTEETGVAITSFWGLIRSVGGNRYFEAATLECGHVV